MMNKISLVELEETCENSCSACSRAFWRDISPEGVRLVGERRAWMCGVEEGRKGVSSSVRPFLFFDNKFNFSNSILSRRLFNYSRR